MVPLGSSTNIVVESKPYSLLQQHCLYLPSLLVPIPFITVSNTETVVYAGTTLSLTCDYTLSPSVDTTLKTVVTWMFYDALVNTSPAWISIDGATLSFSPLATSDTGIYTCILTVTTSQTHVIVQGEIQSAWKTIRVTGIYPLCMRQYRLYSLSFPFRFTIS